MVLLIICNGYKGSLQARRCWNLSLWTKVRENMCDLKFGDKVSDTISKAHFMKEKLDKLGFITSKIFYPVKKTFKWTER